MDRLRQRADFLAVADGPRMNSAAFVVQSRARGDDGPVRIGFTVTKKVGTATERNRVRPLPSRIGEAAGCRIDATAQ
jgi:ribonuclease P protein component